MYFRKSVLSGFNSSVTVEMPSAQSMATADAEPRARSILGLTELMAGALPPRVEQLWRMDGFAGDVPFTNPMFVPLGISPDMGLVYEAVARTVDRHPALRTRLTVKNGRGVQIVEAWKTSRIPVAEILRRQLEEDRPDAPPSPIGEFTKGSMDLFAQDGLRTSAFRDEDGGVTLGFLAHGFYSDAWSSQILLQDFRAFHSALKDGTSPALADAASYIEYAESQRRALDKDLPARLSFWRRKLSVIQAAALPYDHQTYDRQTGVSRRGRSYFFIREEIFAGLAAASATHRISLTLLLLAAFQLSLGRWSGQREILSAAYTADRVKPQFQNTTGCLVTNMPVSARLEPERGFGAFLSEFAKDFYGSYPHREISCEIYDAIFAPPKPFCATVFNFVPLQKRFSAGELLSLPAFDQTLVGPDAAKPAIYRDIYLGLAQYPNGLLGKLFYDAGLFTPKGMEVFIGHFRHVAEKIAADPDIKLRDILC
jgi:hypothetical protein